jgi:hypothetical protein
MKILSATAKRHPFRMHEDAKDRGKSFRNHWNKKINSDLDYLSKQEIRASKLNTLPNICMFTYAKYSLFQRSLSMDDCSIELTYNWY